jgi:hypothetical protein
MALFRLTSVVDVDTGESTGNQSKTGMKKHLVGMLKLKGCIDYKSPDRLSASIYVGQ